MIPDNTILVSLDIVNMYSSINNDRFIAAVKNALEIRQVSRAKSTLTNCIKEDHKICLKCNNCRFGL